MFLRDFFDQQIRLFEVVHNDCQRHACELQRLCDQQFDPSYGQMARVQRRFARISRRIVDILSKLSRQQPSIMRIHEDGYRVYCQARSVRYDHIVSTGDDSLVYATGGYAAMQRPTDLTTPSADASSPHGDEEELRREFEGGTTPSS